ncbi:MAG: putative rane protein [Actinomycetia bacterium]|nr:putative rane protein [Actinomycetes bacterium]
MTAPAWIALVVAAGFAVADWIANARDDRALEYVAKPATLVALVAVAVALDPADSTLRAWFVAALVFSLAGDVLLMLPKEQFVAGLAAFLVGHVCYVVGFWVDPPSGRAFAVAALVVVVCVSPVAVRVLRALRGSEDAALAPPVTAYIGVISVMVASALASGNPVAGAGATLFAVSDSMIAWSRFVRPFRAAPVAIMVTYHVGQALLVLSMVS